MSATSGRTGKRATRSPALAAAGGGPQPEGAGAPRVEGEPALDAVGEVPALPQLLPEKVDGTVRHGAEYSTRSDVLSRDFSMNSAESVRPRPLGKILSGILLAGSLIL